MRSMHALCITSHGNLIKQSYYDYRESSKSMNKERESIVAIVGIRVLRTLLSGRDHNFRGTKEIKLISIKIWLVMNKSLTGINLKSNLLK